jgi:NAD+ synthase
MLKITPEVSQSEIERSIKFIQARLAAAQTSKIVIAVSGGIDSAVALSLAVKAVGPTNVTALLLPYAEQDMADAQVAVQFNNLPVNQILTLPITQVVQTAAAAATLSLQPTSPEDKLRLGNLMARSRMLFVFDTAKKLGALVSGTENRSEHYLGYFTRFGDEASDFEPLASWWKTEVRAVAQALNLPPVFLTKAPSAGLWPGQTDEMELGFSYDQADLILSAWLDDQVPEAQLSEVCQVTGETVKAVLNQVKSTKFKREVPYRLADLR